MTSRSVLAHPFVAILMLLTIASVRSQTQSPGSAEIDALDARMELARVLRNDALLAEAEAEYRVVLAAAPDDPGVREELAEVLIWQKRPEDAREIMKEIPLDALTPTGLKIMGDLAVQSDEFAEAQRWFEKALVESPDDPKIRFALAEALAWQKDYAASAAQLEVLIEKYPGDVQLRRRYAQVLGWAGRNKDAAAQWRLSLEAATE